MNTVRVLGVTTTGVVAQSRRLISTRPLHLKGRINYLSGREVSSLPSAPRRAAAPRGLDADGLAVAGRGGWSRLEVAAAATAVAAASAAVAWDQHNAGDGAGCSSTDGIVGNPYEPGQAVGVGIKAEMWKTKHPNLTVLETGDDTPVLGLLSIVRNAETEGAAFVSAANRLMRQLLDYAVMGFPSDEEAEFVTPARVMMQGVLPEDDVEVCAISVYLEHEPRGVFDFELEAAFPSFERGCLHVRGLTRGSGRELPRNMKGKQVLLLAPVVGYAQAVLAALERLEQAGVADEDVTLVSVVISKEAVETLTEEAGDMRVVCAAMDGETRGGDHQVVPGVGKFSVRYFEAKAAMEAEALERAKELSKERSSSRRRFWWPWRGN